MNICKPLINSFFRTLGRILCYVLVGAILSFIFSKYIVKADTIDAGAYTTISGYSWYPDGFWYSTMVSNSSKDLKFELFSSHGDLLGYNTLIIDFCSSGFAGANKLTRKYAIGQGCANSCFGTSIQVQDLMSSSKSYEGYACSNFRAYVPISKLSVATGCTSTSCSNSLEDYLTFSNNFNYNLPLTLSGIYLTDDVAYSNGGITQDSIDRVNSSIISLKDNINDTNSKLDDVNSNISDTNSKLDDVNSKLSDSSSPDLDGLNNSAGWLPAGAIDSVLNLPLTFLNSLTTNLSKSCNPVELSLPYINKSISLPCLNSIYSQIDGLSVWINTIGVIASAFILFQYLLSLYKWVDDTLSFRENNFIDNWSGV